MLVERNKHSTQRQRDARCRARCCAGPRDRAQAPRRNEHAPAPRCDAPALTKVPRRNDALGVSLATGALFTTRENLGLREIVLIRVRAPLGVIGDEVQDSLDQAPQRTDTAGQDRYYDLPHTDIGVPEVEAVDAPTAQEDSQESGDELRLWAGRRLAGVTALRRVRGLATLWGLTAVRGLPARRRRHLLAH